jgi:hypothetical protein
MASVTTLIEGAIVVIAIVIVFAAVAAVLAGALAFAATRVEVASTSTSSFGGFVVSAPMPARPRGVQEEDLPPFVFHDRPAPVHARSSAPSRYGHPATVGG